MRTFDFLNFSSIVFVGSLFLLLRRSRASCSLHWRSTERFSRLNLHFVKALVAFLMFKVPSAAVLICTVRFSFSKHHPNRAHITSFWGFRIAVGTFKIYVRIGWYNQRSTNQLQIFDCPRRIEIKQQMMWSHQLWYLMNNTTDYNRSTTQAFET